VNKVGNLNSITKIIPFSDHKYI